MIMLILVRDPFYARGSSLLIYDPDDVDEFP